MKIVTAEEMGRLEKCGAAAGCREESFMENAGRQIAKRARLMIQERHLPHEVILLAGRGNNGGDGYAAALKLLEMGFKVTAYHLDSAVPCSALNQLYSERFRAQGGKVHAASECQFLKDQLVIDGLLGSGCRQEVQGSLAEWIEKANQSGAPILSIDLPSGVHGNSGTGAHRAIRATETLALGFPKVGMFLGDAWNCVGNLFAASFGLPEEVEIEAQAEAFWLQACDVSALIPQIVRNRHKYQAGLVVGLGGSAGLCGAPKLSSFAALRAGAGMVRLFYPQEAREEMRGIPWEIIHEVWTEKHWLDSLAKARACFFGPGLGRSPETGVWLNDLVSKISLPSVIDADALFLLKKMPSQAVLTPHLGEMRWLRDADEDAITRVRCAAEDHQAVILLKGAPTFVCAPGERPIVITAGDPGMATAGAGDVLTGIIAALLAQGCAPLQAALLGAFLHGSAGEFAAKERTSYSLIASDLITFLPKAFAEILSKKG